MVHSELNVDVVLLLVRVQALVGEVLRDALLRVERHKARLEHLQLALVLLGHGLTPERARLRLTLLLNHARLAEYVLLLLLL